MNDNLSARVEYLLGKPYPTHKDLEAHFAQARNEGYRAMLVPSGLVEHAYALAGESDVKVVCTVGFPFGTSDPDVKRLETETAVDFGAHEIELVPSIARLAEERYKEVLREIRDVVDAADERPVKVVIESHLWNETQLAKIAEMVLESGVQFLSTSIALQGRHASAEAVQHLRKLVGPAFGLKIGGFKTLDGAETALLEAGADRIGLAG
jgi:deoxyribose-phosphate aldolase